MAEDRRPAAPDQGRRNDGITGGVLVPLERGVKGGVVPVDPFVSSGTAPAQQKTPPQGGK